MTFERKPYENIQVIIRKHWLILFFKIFQFAVLLGIGFVAYTMGSDYFSVNSGAQELGAFLFAVYVLVVWQVFFIGVMDYFLDTWIITDHRVIDILQHGFFKRDISELRYSSIEDITVKIQGFIPTIFNYGDVIIQTAAEIGEFKFENIPYPNQIKDLVFKMGDQFKKEHVSGEIHEQN